MRRSDFTFELPENLIAQAPLAERDASRLLVLDGETGALTHSQFQSLSDFLRGDDVLVFNNTKVIPARLFGHKASGGAVEILVERITAADAFIAHIRASKAPKPGTIITVANDEVEVTGRDDALFALRSLTCPVTTLLSAHGHMPLPPYIKRSDDGRDQQRYQTVYAQQDGAVAAPTAGLHFTEAMLQRLDAQGITRAEVTLHVGAGTFQPVRADDIADHKMHKEWLTVSAETADIINHAKAAGRRIVAVGTTVVRSLETAAKQGVCQAFSGDTDIFIYPGYEFQIVDAMVTNFHLPESTLLMLVSAFAGIDHIQQAYATAVAEQYRFFSYGDAMFITRNSTCNLTS